MSGSTSSPARWPAETSSPSSRTSCRSEGGDVMSVAVAHHTRSSSGLALAEGARQAAYRGTHLLVVHVVESLDNDIAEANKAGISDAVESALEAACLPDLQWDVRLVPGGRDIADVSEAILATVHELGPDLLVIG